MPIAPPQPSSEPPSPNNPAGMSPKVIFDIVFGLVLFLLTIGAFVFVASSESFTWFNGVIDRMCAAFDTLKHYLSPFRLTSFFARASNAIAGVNDANASFARSGSGGLRSGPPPATVQRSVGRSWVPGLSNATSAHDPGVQTGSTASV